MDKALIANLEALVSNGRLTKESLFGMENMYVDIARYGSIEVMKWLHARFNVTGKDIAAKEEYLFTGLVSRRLRNMAMWLMETFPNLRPDVEFFWDAIWWALTTGKLELVNVCDTMYRARMEKVAKKVFKDLRHSGRKTVFDDDAFEWLVVRYGDVESVHDLELLLSTLLTNTMITSAAFIAHRYDLTARLDTFSCGRHMAVSCVRARIQWLGGARLVKAARGTADECKE